jgi:hypothetical protein
MRSKSKHGHRDVWLRTRKQCLAASTAFLMLPMGTIIDRHDYDQPHLHVDSELAGTTNGLTSRLRRIQVDSGATAVNVKTGTIGLLNGGVDGSNVVAGGRRSSLWTLYSYKLRLLGVIR